MLMGEELLLTVLLAWLFVAIALGAVAVWLVGWRWR